jgi:hypothetical protein
MIESHDAGNPPPIEESIRGKDEEPTEAHGGNESEQSGGSGAGPEGADAKDTHRSAARDDRAAQDDEN